MPRELRLGAEPVGSQQPLQQPVQHDPGRRRQRRVDIELVIGDRGDADRFDRAVRRAVLGRPIHVGQPQPDLVQSPRRLELLDADGIPARRLGCRLPGLHRRHLDRQRRRGGRVLGRQRAGQGEQQRLRRLGARRRLRTPEPARPQPDRVRRLRHRPQPKCRSDRRHPDLRIPDAPVRVGQRGDRRDRLRGRRRSARRPVPARRGRSVERPEPRQRFLQLDDLDGRCQRRRPQPRLPEHARLRRRRGRRLGDPLQRRDVGDAAADHQRRRLLPGGHHHPDQSVCADVPDRHQDRRRRQRRNRPGR